MGYLVAMVTEIKTEQVFSALVNSDTSRLLVVDFYSQTCGPCKVLAPQLEELAQRYQGRATVVKVDVYRLPDLAEVFDISSMPTLVFIRNGRELERVVGANIQRIEHALQKNL